MRLSVEGEKNYITGGVPIAGGDRAFRQVLRVGRGAKVHQHHTEEEQAGKHVLIEPRQVGDVRKQVANYDFVRHGGQDLEVATIRSGRALSTCLM